jgi:glycosyltransferase involved in cell wall biosynthesis
MNMMSTKLSSPKAHKGASDPSIVNNAAPVRSEKSDHRQEIKGLVSIILPVYNVEIYVGECMESLAAQDDDRFELIVIDDGSTDSSIDIVKSYLDRFDRLRIHRQENRGLGGARNTGVRLAEGEFVTFVDSDDIVTTNYVSALRRRQREGNYDIVSGRLEHMSQSGERLGVKDRNVPDLDPKVQPYEAVLGTYLLSVACARLYRLKLLQHSGVSFPDKIPHEDLFYTYKLLRVSDKVADLYDSIYFWRQRDGSLSKSIMPEHIDVLARLRLDTEIFLGKVSANEREYAFAARRNLNLLNYFRQKVNSFNRDCLDIFVNMVRKNRNFILADADRLCNSQLPNENIIDNTKKILTEAGVDWDHRTDEQLQQSSQIDIAFFPLRAYHLNDCLPIINVLRQQGVRAEIIETDGWRDGNDEVSKAASEQGIELTGFNKFLAQSEMVRCVVMWNDWDLLMRVVAQACHAAGTQTVGWVEGIQDYHEVDRGNKRYPYLRSKHIILPGKFDRRYFKNTGQIVHDGEVVRIGLLWESRLRNKPKSSTPKALINSNFSYGVLEEHRDDWVREAVEACLAVGFEPAISRHPFDKGTLYPEYTTKESFSDAIRKCDVSIQRFASGVLEALAMGVPVIYFNPHGEKIDKFTSPNGAYLLTNLRSELESTLRERRFFWHEARAKAFLELHAGLSEHNGGVGDGILRILKTVLQNAQAPSAPLVEKLGVVPPPDKKTALKDKSLRIGPFFGSDAVCDLVPVLAEASVAKKVFDGAKKVADGLEWEICPARNLVAIDTSLEALSREIADELQAQENDPLKVSVIIPCFNAVTHIVPCLESLARQTLPTDQFEVICVDDCSTDRTTELILTYQARIPNLRLIRHEVNQKQGAARNTGLGHARGTYITFVDVDDFLRVDALELLLNVAAGAELVVAQHVLVRYDKPFNARERPRQVKSTLKRAGLDGSIGWWPFGMLIVRGLIEKYAIRFREGVFYEDIDFVIRVSLAASECIVSKEQIYYYVQRDDSTVMSMSEKKLTDSAAAIAEVFDLIRDEQTEEKNVFVSTAKNWLAGQATRLRDSACKPAEKTALSKFFIAELDARSLFKLVGEPLRHQIERKAAEMPPVAAEASECPAGAIPNYQYLPWGKTYEETFRGKVIFFCEVDYHIRSAAPIVRELRERGIDSIIVDASRSTSFSANRPLPEGEEKLYSDVDMLKVNVAERLPFSTDAAAFVFMNDLTYTRRLIFENFGFGVPTIGFYEGINDDWNVDRNALRRPYRSTDYLLLPGIYQKGFYQDRACRVVGLPNVRRRLAEEVVPPTEPMAVINVNFTYNVLEERRGAYVEGAVRACEELGMKYVISQHPADKGDLSRFNVGSESIYDLLTWGSILISRFSTTMLEALAMGRPVVYHNPIDEQVPKFMQPLGAFSKSRCVNTLKHAIMNELDSVAQGVDIRQRAGLFLHFHCNTAAEHEPDALAADAIAEVVTAGYPRFSFKKIAASVPMLPRPLEIMEIKTTSPDSGPRLAEANLAGANVLMKSMQLEKAMKMYLELFQRRPSTPRETDPLSKVYEFNALLAARKLGLKNMKSANSLLQHLKMKGIAKR